MQVSRLVVGFVPLLLVAMCATVALAEENPAAAAAPLKVEASSLTEVTATVEAINSATRSVTLKGEKGEIVTFTADERIKRLNEVKVNDQVKSSYYTSVEMELREATAEELKNPVEVVAGSARAGKESDPAGAVVKTIRAITTVVSLELDAMTVTLKGSQGNLSTIKAKNTENIKKLKLGDTIVVTFTEALAISLEKVPAQ